MNTDISIDIIDEREFVVLEILNKHNNVTQRELAKKTGFSLGLTNIIIKRLIKKGFIKIKKMNKKKILYHLTPKAIVNKTHRTYQYLTKTITDVIEIKNKIQKELLHKGLVDKTSQYFIIGDNEFKEIIKWALNELGISKIEVKDRVEECDNCFVINITPDRYNLQNCINIFEIL